MKVSILTLFHEASDLSRQYLGYWRRNLALHPHLELLFGDNDSKGSTRRLVRECGDWAEVRLFPENYGYSRGNNLLAESASGDVLVFLNNDTMPCEGWLRELLAVFQQRPDIDLVGNLQLSVVDRRLDHAGVFFDKGGRPFHLRPPVGALDRLRWMPVPAVTGACMAVRRSLFERLGGFDASYRNGYEDTDFCMRARDLGKEVFVSTRSCIWHQVGASPGRHAQEDRNEELFLRRWGERTRFLSSWALPVLHGGRESRNLALSRHQTLQVFFPTSGGYCEEDSIHCLYPTDRWTRVSLELPSADKEVYLPIRLDPSKHLGRTRIGGMALRDSASGALLWQVNGGSLLEHCQATGTGEPLRDGGCGIESTGEDPQLLLRLPEALSTRQGLLLSVWLKTDSRQQPAVGTSRGKPSGRKRLLVDLWRLMPRGINGGIKVLCLEILRSLKDDPDIGDRLSCVIKPALEPEMLEILPTEQLIVLDERDYNKAEHSWLDDFQVLYSPVHTSNLWRSGLHRVSLVVDLLHRDYPESLTREDVFLRERIMVETLAESDAVQCNSLFVKQSLRRHYGIDNEQTFVVYNALQHRARRYARPRFSRPVRPYFLYPANTWRHKNHQRLLEAYEAYRSQASAPWDLLLTGCKIGGICEGLPESQALPQGCKWLGFVDEKQYYTLLGEAGAMVFPSLYEGFGIPVLEALQYGVPVACGRCCSLPEVGGDHVNYLDPTDTSDLARALRELASGPKRLSADTIRSINRRFDWGVELDRLRNALCC